MTSSAVESKTWLS